MRGGNEEKIILLHGIMLCELKKRMKKKINHKNGENHLRIQDIKECVDIEECLEAQIHACQGQRTRTSTSPTICNKFTADGKN